jgi:SSS family solute:Na+ symporter
MMIPGVIAFHLYTGNGEELLSIDLAYPQLVKDVLPVYLSGFFLAVLLGAVFSSFNSLLNSAATLFCLDVYQPMVKREVSDQELIRVAKIASVVIAVFSFIVAPLLQYAPDGLWQIIRIFTGFYNIPVIAVVLIGLFTKRVPALGAKVAIGFHILAYTLLKFVLDVELNFIHIYAVLFFAEVGIMLLFGYFKPTKTDWSYSSESKVSLIPWRYALPVSSTMLCGIVMLYLLFSPLGLVGGITPMFWWMILLVIMVNTAVCIYTLRRYDQNIEKSDLI